MDEQNVRWEQRFSNFQKAFAKLTEAVNLIQDRYYVEGEFDESTMSDSDDIIIEGLIQRFEYTHELAWNVMKDFIIERGNVKIYGSRDATREAFQLDLIREGEVWMEMIESRNKTLHTYNEEVANEIFLDILNSYFFAFKIFERTMRKIKNEDNSN